MADSAVPTQQNKNNEEKENSSANEKSKNGGTQMIGGTRVFKKTSPSGYITCYLGKRDFIDHLSHCDPIDGVVLVDPERIGSDKVYVHVLAAFRYGREDLDVLGLTFRKDLFLNNVQVYPPLSDIRRPLTKLQERLMKKLGPNAYPFFFELPHSSPASVTLQPAQNDTGKPCGVDYELKAYAASSADERPHKRNAIRLAIRKLIYAPPDAGPQPSAENVKELSFPHSGVVRLEATLDRQKYYHGEPISINVLVDNNTSKPIKRYKVSIRQYADICLFSTAQYVCPVASLEGEDFIAANQSGWCKVYTLHPILSANRDKRGLALDGKLKHEETNLASSTIIDNIVSKDNLGIIVSYKVKVKLYLAFGAGDIAVELPFILTHALPQSSQSNGSSVNGSHHHHASHANRNSVNTCERLSQNSGMSKSQQQNSAPVAARQGSQSMCENGAAGGAISQQNSSQMGTSLPVVDHNLIQLEDEPDPISVRLDDDNIFEDFARMRLQTHQARNGSISGPATVPVAPVQPIPVQPVTIPTPVLTANAAAPTLFTASLFPAPAAAGFMSAAPAAATLGALQQRQMAAGLGVPISAVAPAMPSATPQFGNTNPFSSLVTASSVASAAPHPYGTTIQPGVATVAPNGFQHSQPFGDSSA